MLKRGGSVVQFWDMAPNMRWLCERQIRRRRRAVAQLLFRSARPCRTARAATGGTAAARFPAGPGQRALRPAADPDRSPAPQPHRADRRGLAGTPGPLHPDLCDATEAARALAWLGDDEREAYAYKRLLLNAWLMLQQARGGSKLPLELRPISSAAALAERLTDVFTATGMEVECDVRRRASGGAQADRDRRRTPGPLALRRPLGGNHRLRRGNPAPRPRRAGRRRKLPAPRSAGAWRPAYW